MRVPHPLGKMMTAMKPPAAEVTAGGIALPETAREQVPTAMILSIGEDVTKVKEGDEVLYNMIGNQTYLFEGREYHMLHEDDLIAVVIETDQPELSDADTEE